MAEIKNPSSIKVDDLTPEQRAFLLEELNQKPEISSETEGKAVLPKRPLNAIPSTVFEEENIHPENGLINNPHIPNIEAAKPVSDARSRAILNDVFEGKTNLDAFKVDSKNASGVVDATMNRDS